MRILEARCTLPYLQLSTVQYITAAGYCSVQYGTVLQLDDGPGGATTLGLGRWRSTMLSGNVLYEPASSSVAASLGRADIPYTIPVGWYISNPRHNLTTCEFIFQSATRIKKKVREYERIWIPSERILIQKWKNCVSHSLVLHYFMRLDLINVFTINNFKAPDLGVVY